MKVHHMLAAAALASATLVHLGAAAGERPTITNPNQLKPGQCVYAGEVYEPGELIVGKVKGIAQVCANIDGRGVGVTITKDSMDLLHIAAG